MNSRHKSLSQKKNKIKYLQKWKHFSICKIKTHEIKELYSFSKLEFLIVILDSAGDTFKWAVATGEVYIIPVVLELALSNFEKVVLNVNFFSIWKLSLHLKYERIEAIMWPCIITPVIYAPIPKSKVWYDARSLSKYLGESIV